VVVYQRKILKKNLIIQEVEDTLKDQELDSVYSIVEAQIDERKRIAKELHDNVGSVLATLKMYADTLPLKPADEQLKLAKDIAQITEKAGLETRRLSHSLNEGISDHFGFAQSLIEMTRTLNNLGRLQVDVSGELDQVPDNERGIQILRIIQELVSNTVKHAQAKNAEMTFTRVGKSINLIYEDNGRGFDMKLSKRGIGLNNIISRLESIGGELEMDSEVGKGSTFSIDFPIS